MHRGYSILTHYLVQASCYNKLYATKFGEVEMEILQSQTRPRTRIWSGQHVFRIMSQVENCNLVSTNLFALPRANKTFIPANVVPLGAGRLIITHATPIFWGVQTSLGCSTSAILRKIFFKETTWVTIHLTGVGIGQWPNGLWNNSG